MKSLIKRDGSALLLLVLMFLTIEAVVNPVGEFPLNDDWSYTASLRYLYTTHHLRLGGFTSMPLVAQLGWGLIFCDIFGFSFTVVRCSTLVLSLAALVFCYFLIKELSGSRKLSFAGSLMLLVNPVFLNLSNTFMTDVPFLCMLLGSLLFFVRGLKQDRWWFIAAGICFVVAASLIRQLGLLVPPAFALVYVCSGRRDIRRVLTAAVVVVVPVGVYVLYNGWLKRHDSYPVMYDEGTKQIWFHLFGSSDSRFSYLFRQVLDLGVYCGFFIFPLIFMFDERGLFRFYKFRYYYLFLLLAGAGYCLFFRRLMPFTGNVINPYGLGSITLRDVMILKADHLRSLPPAVWVIMTAAGFAGVGLLLFILVRILRPGEWRRAFPGTYLQASPDGFFLTCFLLLYAGVMVVGASFDRYYLPILPIVCALAGSVLSGYLARSRISAGLFCMVLIVYGVYSTALTGDYLSWNRARWQALHWLMDEQGVSADRIDGGFEFNGYYLYDGTPMELRDDPDKPSWWWVKGDDYLVSFGPLGGYEIVRKYPWKRNIGLPGVIYILKKK